MNWKKALIPILCLIILSCSSNKSLTGYYEDVYVLDRDFTCDVRAYQRSQGEVELHFSVNAGDLLYKKTIDDEFLARVGFKVKSVSDFENGLRTDTTSFEIVDKVSKTGDRLIQGYSVLPFPVMDTVSYHLTVTIGDKNMSTESVHHVFLETDKADGRFVKFKDNEGLPLLHNVLTEESVNIESNWFQSYELSMKQYKDDFQMPLPPFSMDEVSAFSGRIIETNQVFRKEDGTYNVSCPEGRICLIEDATSKKSFALRNASKTFPDVTEMDKLVEVLRYISTLEEYTEISYSEDKKRAFEDFWLTCSGSRERAKKLIAEFYHRVKESDRFFTSHVEGWRTDRGMLHIIYGPPSRMTRDGDKETWYYGRSEDSTGLRFVFIRAKGNPFSGNDFRLVRELNYKPSWYMAVDAWRGGKIVNF